MKPNTLKRIIILAIDLEYNVHYLSYGIMSTVLKHLGPEDTG